MNPSKKMNLSLAFEEDNTSMCKVLNSDGMLGEILKRLHCPTCLVRAALTSRRWLRNASGQDTTHGFRSRQSPYLLGIYVTSEGFCQPEFVPLPDASSPELEAALHHGNFGLDGMVAFQVSIWDCRNDRILYGFDGSFNLGLVPATRMPLQCPGEDTAVFPPPPPTTWPEWPHVMLLPDKDNDDVSCYRVHIFNMGHTVGARVFALRAGSWIVHCLAYDNLYRAPAAVLRMTMLIHSNIYMMTVAGFILTLDLATARFCIIDLPEDVEFEEDNVILAPCHGNNPVLHLVHLNGDNLTVWLQRMTGDGDGDAASEWSLRDTIPLREACAHIEDLIWELEDEEGAVSVVGVGDNAEFVFLEFNKNGVIVYIHLHSREAKVVYERDPNNDFVIQVYPFMMVWSPVFLEVAAAPAE